MVLRNAIIAIIAVTLAAPGCVSLDDRCQDVACGEGEICVDVEPAPECVCDDQHVKNEDTGACVPLEEDA